MPDISADSRSAIDALLTEHFRYTPLSLIDDIINTVNAIVYRAIQAIENGLLSAPPQALGFGSETTSKTLSIPDADGDGNVDFPEARDEIENGVHQLETLLEATVDKNFDKFEIYTLRNILTVPPDLAPWIRLKHYQDLTLPLPPSAPTPDSILALRRKLQETQKLNLALEQEYVRHTALVSQVRSLLAQPPDHAQTKGKEEREAATSTSAPFEFLNANISGVSSQHLTTSAQFTVAQLPALRSLLATLKSHVASLPPKVSQVDWRSETEQRRAYIEERTKKVLRENDVEDAIGDKSLGRKLSEDEVKDLEVITGGMGTEDGMVE